jgi:hypothetical protein
MKKVLSLALALLSLAGVASSQDLGKSSQLRTVTTTAGLACDPLKGEVVFKTVESSMYLCTATNTWSPIYRLPVFNAQNNGAKPRTSSTPPTTTVSCTAGSTNCTAASAIDLVNGEGVVIFGAGAATTQSTPGPPVVTAPAVKGSRTFSYQCVGSDGAGGLTPAGTVGAVTTGPTIFAPPPVAISSISLTSNTVTANFAAPINGATGESILVSGITGAGAAWNGTFTIATAPLSSQVTFPLTGANGTGTVSAASKGWLTNTRNVTAISRTALTLTVTTDGNHNYAVQSPPYKTIAVISGVLTPPLFNGEYPVLTASGNTLTLDTAQSTDPPGNTDTGTVVPGVTTVSVYEYIDVLCPVIAPPTVQYYVYGDSVTTGVMAYLGAPDNKQRNFRDWGPLYGAGAFRPAYVPATPPVSAQNKSFSSTLASGGGTTALVMTDQVTTTVAGATLIHDETPAITAALAAATANGGGTVYLPQNSGNANLYVLNSPLTVPINVDLMLGGNIWANEPVTLIGLNKIKTTLGGSGRNAPQFGTQSYQTWGGNTRNLLIVQGNSVAIDGVEFISLTNGQNFVFVKGAYNYIKNSFFAVGNGTNIGLTYQGTVNGGPAALDVENIGSLGYGPLGATNGPPIPAMWFKTSDEDLGVGNGNMVGPGSFRMHGNNTMSGRGILFDRSYVSNGACGDFHVDGDWNQAATMPMVMWYGGSGQNCANIYVKGVLLDTAQQSIFANWSQISGPVFLEGNSDCCGIGQVTGSYVPGLTMSGASSSSSPAGQNFGMTIDLLGPTDVDGACPGAACQSLAQKRQNEPMIFGGPKSYPVAWKILPPTGVTVTTTGAGSWPAGVQYFCVSSVGWNGGSTVPGAPVQFTSAGSQNVKVDWTAVPNVKGYNVYENSGSCGPGGLKQNTTPIQGTTYTMAAFANQGAAPTYDGTGLPLVDPNQVASALFRLANGLFSTDYTVAALTANRTLAGADGAASVVVSASLVTTAAASDNVAIQGATSSSHCQLTPTNAAAAMNVATTYVSAKTANQITVTHTATGSMNYDVACTVN